MRKSIFCLSLAVLAVSCAKEINPGASEQNLAPMQFEISVEATRTALASDGKSVNWIDGDKVAIFDGGASGKEFTVQSSAQHFQVVQILRLQTIMQFIRMTEQQRLITSLLQASLLSKL